MLCGVRWCVSEQRAGAWQLCACAVVVVAVLDVALAVHLYMRVSWGAKKNLPELCARQEGIDDPSVLT